MFRKGFLPLLSTLLTLLADSLAQNQGDSVPITPGTAQEFDGTRSHIVLIQGGGPMRIVVANTSGLEKRLMDYVCLSYDTKWCVLPTFDSENLYISVDCIETPCKDSRNISLVQQSGLEWKPKSEQYLPIQFPDEGATLFLAVMTQNLLPKDGKPEDYRLRFEADSREHDLSDPGFYRNSSGLSMEVTSFPQNTHLPRNATEIGSDLMLTLTSTDQGFCLGGQCGYYVKLTSSKVPHVVFTTKVIEKVSRVQVKTSDHYYLSVSNDQVYKGMDNRYVFEVEEEGDIHFQIIPVEGNPDIYLNLDEDLGFDSSKYHYKSEKDNVEVVMISAHERDRSAGKGKKIYCVIKSEADATYYLVSEWRKKGSFANEATPIIYNAFYSGGLRSGEIRNFILDLKNDIPETIGFFVNLKARGGNPDLYVKDCEEKNQCSFTTDEIKQKHDLALSLKNLNENSTDYAKAKRSIGNLFLYSDTQTPDDSLYVNLNTVPGGGDEYTTTNGAALPTFPNSQPISKFNKICIAVVGNSNSVSQLSEFTLMVNGMVGHSVLFEYRSEIISLGPKDEKYYIYSPHLLPEGAKGVQIHFEIAIGDASFYYSTSAKYPDAEFNDEEVEIDNDQSKIESIKNIVSIPVQKLEGSKLYLGFVAKKQSIIKVLLTYWLPDPVKGEPTTLILNAPIYRTISKSSDFNTDSYSDTYKLTSYSDKGKAQDIFIRVNQVYGNLRICAVPMDKSKYLTPSDCIVSSDEDMLIIPGNEVAKKPVTEWLVFVYPKIMENEVGSVYSSYDYVISLLGKGSASQIVNRGEPVQDAVTTYEGNIHYHDFWLTNKDEYLTIILEPVKRGQFFSSVVFSLKGFNAEKAVEPVSASSERLNRQFQGLVYSAKDIRKTCDMPVDGEDPNARILKQDEEGPSVLKTISPTVKCRVYVKVNEFHSEGSNNQYRLWILKDTDRLRLTNGKQYTLPYPGSSSLKLEVPLDKIDKGVFSNFYGVFDRYEAIGVVEAKLKSNGNVVEASKKAFAKGTGYQNINLENSALVELNKYIDDNKYETTLKIDISRYKSEEYLASKKNVTLWPYDVTHVIKVQPSNLVATITPGEPMKGVVLQGNYKYYELELNATEDATVMLHTIGFDDADLYIQKGHSFPDMNNYFLKSVNFNSDEIFIKGDKSPESVGNKVTYIIGISGVTPSCEYTLTVVKNGLKVVNLDVGELFTTQITNKSPLVIRHNWSKESNLRAFFYSFDSSLIALTGVETDAGILKSLPTIENTPLLATTSALDPGSPKEIPLFGTTYSEELNNLIAIYPDGAGEATVTIFLMNPNMPIALKEGDIPLKVILDKDQQIICRLSVASGEIGEMVVKVDAPIDTYTVDYPKSKFKLTSTRDTTSRERLYYFTDNNKADRENSLLFTVVSKIKGNKIGVSISNSQTLHKLSLGDTYVIELKPGNTSQLYMELARNENIHVLRFDLAYPSYGTVTSSLLIKRTDQSGQEQEEVSLDEKTIDGVKTISQSITVRKGVYLLQLANPSQNPLKVRVRFSMNNLQEMESNGVYYGLVSRSKGENIQLMITQPGYLNLTVFTCRSNLDIYLTQDKIQSAYNDNEKILSTNGQTVAGTQTSYTKYYNEPTSLYIHVAGRGTNESEYTLTSKFNPGVQAPLSEVAILPPNITSVYANRATNKLVAIVDPPAFDDRQIKAVYPTATRIRFDVTAVLYVPLEIEGSKRDSLFDEAKYCWRDLHQKGVHLANTSLTYHFGAKMISKQLYIPFDYKKTIEDESKLGAFGTWIKPVTRVKAIVTVSYYEEGSSVALGTTVVSSNVYVAKYSDVDIDMNDNRNQKWYQTWWGMVLIVLIMVLVMLVALFLFYVWANKLSGGYDKIDGLNPNMNNTALETTQHELAQMAAPR